MSFSRHALRPASSASSRTIPRPREGSMPSSSFMAAAALLPRLPSAAEWPGYEKLTREQVIAALAKGSASARPICIQEPLRAGSVRYRFKGANLAAAVLNRSNLASANLSRCNLTVSFAEGTNLTNANLQGAMMFSMQLQGANLRGANLSGARLIGDLRRANLEQAVLAKVDGAADMKNQSMGLMRANILWPTCEARIFPGLISPAPISASRTLQARTWPRQTERGGVQRHRYARRQPGRADLSGSNFSTRIHRRQSRRCEFPPPPPFAA